MQLRNVKNQSAGLMEHPSDLKLNYFPEIVDVPSKALKKTKVCLHI